MYSQSSLSYVALPLLPLDTGPVVFVHLCPIPITVVPVTPRLLPLLYSQSTLLYVALPLLTLLPLDIGPVVFVHLCPITVAPVTPDVANQLFRMWRYLCYPYRSCICSSVS